MFGVFAYIGIILAFTGVAVALFWGLRAIKFL